MFSIILGIIGYGHYNLRNAEDIESLESSAWYPSKEFEKLIFERVYFGDSVGYELRFSRFLANFLVILRFSMGDYGDFKQLARMDYAETIMFWLMWLIIVIMTSVIFLNFVIAEVNDSHGRVQANVEKLIL